MCHALVCVPGVAKPWTSDLWRSLPALHFYNSLVGSLLKPKLGSCYVQVHLPLKDLYASPYACAKLPGKSGLPAPHILLLHKWAALPTSFLFQQQKWHFSLTRTGFIDQNRQNKKGISCQFPTCRRRRKIIVHAHARVCRYGEYLSLQTSMPPIHTSSKDGVVILDVECLGL